jgi:hypothetical protein
MKKVLFSILFIPSCLFGQIEGMWKLSPTAGAFAVGPAQGDGSWYTSSALDVTTRACFFDDSISFGAAGDFTHYMDGNTWLEAWQGSGPDGCGVPVAPHDGTTNAPFTYSYNSATGELTVNGTGAHIGLAKVTNAGELSSATPPPVPSSITYLISFSNNDNTMTADINFGGGWWRFVYQRTNAITIPDPNVTFRVNMSDYAGVISTGVYVNGTFNSWCGTCNPLTDMGNGLWEATLPIPAGSIEFLYTVDGWSVAESFTGTESCLDPIPDANNNRYAEISGTDVILPAYCWESCSPCVSIDPQLVGTWKLKEAAGSLAVGPNQGDGSWWSNSVADVTTRACLFDDSVRFEANGSMTQYMDGNTWLEGWQGMTPEGCGSPVAPHDGTTNSPYTYNYSNATGELTTIGIGAHIGLSKVTNSGELSAASPPPVPSSVTYLITLADNDNTMIADINFGGGWWRFVYEKTNIVVAPDPIITFKVDMSEYTGTINTGVFVSGSFNNWCGNCDALTDNGNGSWSGQIQLPVGNHEYLFTVDDWTDFESFTGTESCLDPVADEFNNRYLVASVDANLMNVCWNSCDPCILGLEEENNANISIYPVPASDILHFESNILFKSIEITAVNGESISKNNSVGQNGDINVSKLSSGAYFILFEDEKGQIYKRLIMK